MGDRGNIKVGNVFLYTHWEGSELKKILRTAFKKKWRWDDEPYLTRIIFDVMTDGMHGEETGFGISTGICDNDNPILEVDVKKQKVIEWADENLTKKKKEWDTFETFIEESEQEEVEEEI